VQAWAALRGVKTETITLLAIDDDPELLRIVSSAFSATEDLRLLIYTDAAEALDVIRRCRPQVVLVDLMMPELSGMDVLARIVEIDPAIDVILMTAYYTTESVLEAVGKGACDYINKPFTRAQLYDRVAPRLEEAKRRRHAWQLDEQILDATRFEGIVGRSPLMHDAFARIVRAAPFFRTALISGATGTGKELVARVFHRLSPASRGPFVVCNCAAMPENLIESQMFGHIRGAFTGAIGDVPGMFEAAHGGTLFLDEIGEIPITAQAKLLRAVQSQEIQRVGSPTLRKVDVRIVGATNRNLQEEVAMKNFREDLFFRLSMLEIRLPSLFERREDLPLLIRHFIDRFAKQYAKPIEGITRRAEAAMLGHRWPGNVRELENVIGYACMMTDSVKIDACDLPPGFAAAADIIPRDAQELVSLDEMASAHARLVLEACGGDKKRAADILRVSRATLYRLLSAKTATA
jgi:DNA-binding NtrC family response regulator